MRMLPLVTLVGAALATSLSIAEPRQDALPPIDTSGAADGIVALPASVSAAIREVFVSYTKVVAPNGRPIHILAQDGWSNDRIVKARNVLEHILRAVPGSKYGADKALVANTMADQRAALGLFNTEPDMRDAFRGPLRNLDLAMQDLRANEAPYEGEPDYLEHGTRDASFEEVLHLVHDTGIKPALPQMQNDLRRITEAAIDAGLWEVNQDDRDNEPNEYFAAIYDNYLDLWTVPPTIWEGRPIPPERIDPSTSHHGIYDANGRAALGERDPEGFAILQEFFPPYLTYTPKLPVGFEGTFSIAYDPAIRYTAKSQHLTSVTLRGRNPASLIGNDWDNRLTGNGGDNTLRGNGGDDLLDGGPGADTALFAGNAEDYAIERGVDAIRVTDRRAARDDSDVLLGIEVLAFADRRIKATNLASSTDGANAVGPGARAGDYADLLDLFDRLRRIERPRLVAGLPDYSPEAMQHERAALRALQAELAAIDASGWPVAEQVDYHLVRAEMNGLEFRHRVLAPWRLDPGFYNDILPRLDGADELPLATEDARAILAALRAAPGTLEQARVNLSDLSAVAGDLGTLAVLSLGDTRARYVALQETSARRAATTAWHSDSPSPTPTWSSTPPPRATP